MKFFKQLQILALLPLFLIVSCNNDDEPTVLQPEVMSTTPVDDATNVATNVAVKIKFNKKMDAATLSTTSVTLFQGSNQVDGIVTYVDSTATFTPESHLLPNELFIVTVTKAAKDTDGNPLKNEYTFSFTSGEAPDLTIPTITITDPISDATDVDFDQVIVVTFSEEMDTETIDETSFTLKHDGALVEGTVTTTANTAIFTPTEDLGAGMNYDVKVSTAVTDLSGIALAAAKEWSFTTDALPTISAVFPLDASIDAALNTTVSITFSEVMDATTFTSSSFVLNQGTSSVSGDVTYAGNTATFTPEEALTPGLVYTAKVTTDVKNLEGISIGAAKTWEFTADVLPTITLVDPLNNATDVARNKAISITFSEAMDLTSINLTSIIVKHEDNVILGTIEFIENTVRFIPTVALGADLTYDVTVKSSVKDLGGNAIVEDNTWSFTTGGELGLAVVNLRAAGNYVILAKTAINNTPTSAITGHLGLSPAATSYITGFALTDATGYATSSQITGKVYAADMASPTDVNLTTAIENMLTAYTDAASRPTPDFLNLLSGNIGGETLQAGLYKFGTTVTIPGDITLSGSEDAVWIFQIDNDLTMSANVNIILTGGAQAKNIFWQVAGEAVIGANSHFEGIILSMTGITLETGASYHGRMLAQTAVILDQNAVTKP